MLREKTDAKIIKSSNPQVDFEDDDQTIKDIINDNKPLGVTIDNIINEVAKTYNVSVSDILSNRRTASLALARQVAMYIARETTDLSYKQIGESFGKDHTTVMYAVDKIEKTMADDASVDKIVNDLINALKN